MQNRKQNPNKMVAPHSWHSHIMGRSSIFMLEKLYITVPLAIALGTLSGLGVGGGSLLMVWLTAFLNYEPIASKNINLLFFIPSAIIVCCYRWKNGKLEFKKLIPAVVAGCICSAVFPFLAKIISTDFLKKILGALFILTGTKEIFYRPRKDK